MYKPGTEVFIPCTIVEHKENGEVVLSSDTDGSPIRADISQVYELEDMKEIVNENL